MVAQILTFNRIWILEVLRWGKAMLRAVRNANAHGLSYFLIFTTSINALRVRLVPCAKMSTQF